MADGASRNHALEHLEKVLASPSFRRAGMQAAVLRALLEAALEGDEPTGRELARKVYGRDNEASLQALRQTVRNVRRSLDLYYAGLPSPTQVRFEFSSPGYNLRVLEQGQVQQIDKTPRRGLAGRLILAILLMGGVIVATAMIASLFWPDPFPARVETRDGLPVVVDARGREINEWTERLQGGLDLDLQVLRHEGQTPAELAKNLLRSAILTPGGVGQYPRVAVADMTTDEPGEGQLLLFDGRDGREIDSLPLPYFPDLPDTVTLHFDEEGPTPSHFYVSDFEVSDLDGDGQHELVLGLTIGSGMDPNYPTQLIALDVDDGKWVVRRNYWAAGNMAIELIQDLDRDGNAEIVLRGMNNDYNDGMLVILKLDEPDGRTPLGPRRKIFREIENLEENGLIIRFPRTVLSVYDPSRSLRASVNSIDLGQFPDRFLVTVGDFNPVVLGPGELNARIRFDLDLTREEIRVNFLDYDFYLAEMKKMIALGDLEDKWHIMETKRLDEYGKYLATQVLYWDGSEPDPEWKQLTPARLKTVLGR